MKYQEGGFNTMSRRDRDFLTRSESKRRSNRTEGRKKLDRLLNVLIAIVAVLILINLYFVFSNNEEKVQDDHELQSSENVAPNNENDTENSSTSNEEDVDNPNTDSNVKDESNTDISSSSEGSNESENISNFDSKTIIVQGSNDPVVEQVIIDPNWQVTLTKQTGKHVSTYEEGHIDFEEKKETIQNAVNLTSDNIIFWRIQNNGSSENAIAVVSSMDKLEKYRVSIEWIENQGWKPVKVEILNDIEGAF